MNHDTAKGRSLGGEGGVSSLKLHGVQLQEKGSLQAELPERDAAFLPQLDPAPLHWRSLSRRLVGYVHYQLHSQTAKMSLRGRVQKEWGSCNELGYNNIPHCASTTVQEGMHHPGSLCAGTWGESSGSEEISILVPAITHTVAECTYELEGLQLLAIQYC